MTDINDIKRELEALTAKVAAYEAEKVAKRNWPERIEAGMVFALFDQLFMPFSHANDGVCRWKICLNDGTISEIGTIGSSSTAFGYKGRGSDGLRWSDPTEACMNAADAHEPTGAELVGRVCEVMGVKAGRPATAWSPTLGVTWADDDMVQSGAAAWHKDARLAK